MTLSVQLAPHRRKRLQRKIEVALEQAGPPYRSWAVVAHDSSDETIVEVQGLGFFLARLEAAIEKEPVAETQAWMRGCLENVMGYYDRGLIPEWLTFAEGGAELNTIEPPEGTW
jgi:hypothetical protein